MEWRTLRRLAQAALAGRRCRHAGRPRPRPPRPRLFGTAEFRVEFACDALPQWRRVLAAHGRRGGRHHARLRAPTASTCPNRATLAWAGPAARPRGAARALRQVRGGPPLRQSAGRTGPTPTITAAATTGRRRSSSSAAPATARTTSSPSTARCGCSGCGPTSCAWWWCRTSSATCRMPCWRSISADEVLILDNLSEAVLAAAARRPTTCPTTRSTRLARWAHTPPDALVVVDQRVAGVAAGAALSGCAVRE